MLKEALKKSFETDIKYHESRIRYIKEKISDRSVFSMAEKIDRILAISGKVLDFSCSLNYISITFENVEDARDFVSKVMDRFGLRTFNKTFLSYSDKPVWHWKETVNNIDLSVYPTEAPPDCDPVKVSYEIKREKWICATNGRDL